MVAWQASGIMPAELADRPELPPLGLHVWTWFLELHQARGGNGFGPSPLSYRELTDWSTLTGQRLEPWEVRAVMAVDRAYMASVAEEMKREAKG